MLRSWHNSNKDNDILEAAGLSYRHNHEIEFTDNESMLEIVNFITAEIFNKTNLNVMLLKRGDNIIIGFTVGSFSQRR